LQQGRVGAYYGSNLCKRCGRGGYRAESFGASRWSRSNSSCCNDDDDDDDDEYKNKAKS
jgi:hypothetical protein